MALGLLALSAPSRAVVFDDSGLTQGLQPDRADKLRESGRIEPQAVVFQGVPLGEAAAARAEEPDRISGKVLFSEGQGDPVPARQLKVLLWGDQELLQTTETDASGSWSFPLPAGQYRLRARLENARWSLRDAQTSNPFEWEIGAGTYRIALDSDAGRIAAVHRQFLDAFDALKKAGIDPTWWSQRLSVYYPGDGNYFSSNDFSLHITRADAWDVNLHELGHAIMSAGTRSYGGGGAHRISQCYNAGLAWSEGSATFLAAVARLDPKAADPRFVNLAGGIPIENVPGTVCQGETNEWRVAAALWDLYDVHEDGLDRFNMSFARLWGAIEGRSMGSFSDAWGHIRAALRPEETAGAEGALEQNTLSSGASVAQAPRGGGPTAPPNLLNAFSAPSFDGSALR